jgi:hypothetical protein
MRSDTVYFCHGELKLGWQDNIKMDLKRIRHDYVSDYLVRRKDSGHGVGYDCGLCLEDETSNIEIFAAHFVKLSAHREIGFRPCSRHSAVVSAMAASRLLLRLCVPNQSGIVVASVS